MLNPGACLYRGSVVLIYRAVGGDGISRFGFAASTDGERFDREEVPVYEARLDDPFARLGIEDPRITALEHRHFLTYTKASVEPATQPPLYWEPAPYRIRSAVAGTTDLRRLSEVGVVRPGVNTKDLVLFPQKIDGEYVALIREFPHIQLIRSVDLHCWSEPAVVLSPIPGTWEGERVGAGPPPLLTERGWIVLYHANEFLKPTTNERHYRLGLALFDRDDPTRLLYRHPKPVFEPETPYEREGPVGNVVFGTGLIRRDGELWLYYGAGDGVIGVAVAEQTSLEALIPKSVDPSGQLGARGLDPFDC